LIGCFCSAIREESQLHDLRLFRGNLAKLVEGFIELQNDLFLGRNGNLNVIQRHRLTVSDFCLRFRSAKWSRAQQTSSNLRP